MAYSLMVYIFYGWNKEEDLRVSQENPDIYSNVSFQKNVHCLSIQKLHFLFWRKQPYLINPNKEMIVLNSLKFIIKCLTYTC